MRVTGKSGPSTAVGPSRRALRDFCFATVMSAVVSAVGVVVAPAPVSAQKPPVVVSKPVVKTTFVDRAEALGTLYANETVEITALVTDRIAHIHFQDGERVEAGQILAEMLHREEDAALSEARARREEAAEQLVRAKKLAGRGSESQAVLSVRQREFNVAEAQVVAVEARIADRIIRAPFAGRVGLRNVSPGATVAPGEMIARVIDDSVMKLDFSVPSTHLAKLAPGLAIEARARAFPGMKFTGKITSLDSVVDPVARSISVRAVLPNPERKLVPGLLMEVDLFLDSREALVVDEGSLIPSGDKVFVLVIVERDGRPHAARREVVTGSRRVGQVEILSGLKEGERVITDGGLKVRPGQPVSPREAAFKTDRKPAATSDGK